MVVSSYDFSCSKKKRWIKIFKHIGCRLKIVFSLHRVTRRIKKRKEKNSFTSARRNTDFNDNNEREFSLMLGIKKMGL